MKSKTVVNVLFDFTKRVQRDTPKSIPSWAQGG